MTFLLDCTYQSLVLFRNQNSVCQKLKVHSQSEKADILRDLCNRFLDLPLTSKSQENKVRSVKRFGLLSYSTESIAVDNLSPERSTPYPEQCFNGFDFAD